jgi:hypothetical protein
MRSKVRLFGCQPITEEGESVILLKKQKVYGGEDYDWKAISVDMTRRAPFELDMITGGEGADGHAAAVEIMRRLQLQLDGVQK